MRRPQPDEDQTDEDKASKCFIDLLVGFFLGQIMALTFFLPRCIVDRSHVQPLSKQSDKIPRP